jgi:hypothetical protein
VRPRAGQARVEVVVTLDKQANVQLINSSNYSNYANGRRYQYFGGLMTKSPATIAVPRDGHWNVAIDLGGNAGAYAAVPPSEPQ